LHFGELAFENYQRAKRNDRQSHSRKNSDNFEAKSNLLAPAGVFKKVHHSPEQIPYTNFPHFKQP
jgi:hypothetical protein